MDSAPLACDDCHDADLSAEHAGITSSAGLSGCDVCHALYGGEFGTAVQSAIATTNDTRCSACHATYHTNTSVHEATSDASKACAVCHTQGGTQAMLVVARAAATAGRATPSEPMTVSPV